MGESLSFGLCHFCVRVAAGWWVVRVRVRVIRVRVGVGVRGRHLQRRPTKRHQ